MRLLIFLLLIYLCYRVLKKWMLSGQLPKESAKEESLTPVDDVMVKDPFCETYFPKRSAIKEVIEGQNYYFCSKECRNKYLEAISNSKQ